MNEVIREFILETNENLEKMNQDLVKLAKEPTDSETLARVFRTLHTVKGTAGFMGLMKLQALAHSAESLLSKLRSGELTFKEEISKSLFLTMDLIEGMLPEIEENGSEGSIDCSAVIELLEQLRIADADSASPPSSPPPAKPAPPAPKPAVPPKPAPMQMPSLSPTLAPQPPSPAAPVVKPSAPQPRVQKPRAAPPPPPDADDEDDPDFMPRNGAEHTRIWATSKGPLARPDQPEEDVTPEVPTPDAPGSRARSNARSARFPPARCAWTSACSTS